MFFDLLPVLELPYQKFFMPKDKFLEVMASKYSDVGILEAGCGVGYTLSKIRDHGKEKSIDAMQYARGFDCNFRTEYDVPAGVIFTKNALECEFYHKGLQVVVCRPDHSGWVSILLDNFLCGLFEVKRFIYVGLEENVLRDFDVVQLTKSTSKILDVGEDGEVMLVWEFDYE